jgi:hypothetical protein
MAQETPLDSAVVQAWLSAWNESDVFSDAAIQHLQSLIADTHCFVVITLGVGRESRSLVFRRVKRVLEAHHESGAPNAMTLNKPSSGGRDSGCLLTRRLPSPSIADATSY